MATLVKGVTYNTSQVISSGDKVFEDCVFNATYNATPYLNGWTACTVNTLGATSVKGIVFRRCTFQGAIEEQASLEAFSAPALYSVASKGSDTLTLTLERDFDNQWQARTVKGMASAIFGVGCHLVVQDGNGAGHYFEIVARDGNTFTLSPTDLARFPLADVSVGDHVAVGPYMVDITYEDCTAHVSKARQSWGASWMGMQWLQGSMGQTTIQTGFMTYGNCLNVLYDRCHVVGDGPNTAGTGHQAGMTGFAAQGVTHTGTPTYPEPNVKGRIHDLHHITYRDCDAIGVDQSFSARSSNVLFMFADDELLDDSCGYIPPEFKNSDLRVIGCDFSAGTFSPSVWDWERAYWVDSGTLPNTTMGPERYLLTYWASENTDPAFSPYNAQYGIYDIGDATSTAILTELPVDPLPEYDFDVLMMGAGF